MFRKQKMMGAGAENSADRAFSLQLLWITLGAWLLRLAICRDLALYNDGLNAVFRPSPATDMATYVGLARHPWSEVFYYQPWYYSVFLPVAGWFGHGVRPVILLQSALSAAVVWFTGASARIPFGRPGGYVAAILTALAAPLCLYVPYHLIATVQSFHFALLLYCTLQACRSQKFWWWPATGIILGITILTRGNGWFFLPVLLAAPFFTHASLRRRFLAAGVVLMLTIAVQVPFVWHNSIRLGTLSGPSTAASPVLALGNTPEAPPGGRDFGLPAGPMEYPEAYSAMLEREKQGISVPRQILAWAISEPGAFWELQFRKALLFWEAGEIPNNVSITEANAQSFTLRWLTLPSWILLALGAAGATLWGWRHLHEHPAETWVLYGFLLTGWAGVSAFYVLSRFRTPMLPCIAVFAGGWAAWIAQRYRDSRCRLRAAGTLALGLWLTLSAGACYRNYLESRILAWVRPQGTEIQLPDGRYCRFDHGPRSFGNWQLEELRPGLFLTKILPATPGNVAKEMDWTVFSAADGDLELSLPDNRQEHFPLVPGENHLKFILPAGNSVCSCRVVATSPNAFAVRDAQRNYRRSLKNGNPLSGEWVVRWRYCK